MGKRTQEASAEEVLLAELSRKIGELRGEIAALRTERDRTRELAELESRIEKLKLEKERLVEANDRKIRETEHQTGLLRRQVEQDQANAETRAALAAQEARLGVREENLTADQARFAAEVTFQREFMEREVGRLETLIKEVLGRVPTVEIRAEGHASTRTEDGR